MSSVDNPYASWGTIAANADVSERGSFIRQTYLHLGGAVLAFAGIEALLLNTPGVDTLAMRMISGRFSWFIVLGAFMGVSFLADMWARSSTSKGLQYAGLGLYVVAESIIFLPMLIIASRFGGPDVIPTAGIITLIIFSGLTLIVFLTGADFSFLRTALWLGGLAAMGLILCSMLFGFSLGIVFVVAMIVLASGYILYDTSNVMHHYCIGQHVAASLALFASVALLFWYVLQLVMSLTSRD